MRLPDSRNHLFSILLAGSSILRAVEIDITKLLNANPALVLFLVLGFGLMLGRIRLAGVEIGAVTGVLLVGLGAGHRGFDIPTSSQSLGFILFIYCVGMQAGPEVVRVFKQDGARYAVLSVVTAVSGLAIASAADRFFDFEFGVAAGALAGGLTSTPTLVAAQDALAQGVAVPAGMSNDAVLANISSAYALTYVFGMGGLVLMIAFLPRMLGIDLAAEARSISPPRRPSSASASSARTRAPRRSCPPSARTGSITRRLRGSATWTAT